MNTLTLSRFTRAMQGNTATPAKPTLAPVVDTLVASTPAVVEKANSTTQEEKTNSFTVETLAPSVNIAPVINNPENEMGKKEDLEAKQEQLRAQLEATEKELDEMRDAERGEVLKTLRKSMAEYGFTVNDLMGLTTVERRAGKVIARGKAPIKFRDPKTGSAWSGRGQKPLWLVSELSNGRKIEDFAV